MATITIKYRPSTVVGREGTLYYQLIHRRQVRQLRTPCKLHPEEWDPRRQCVLIPPDSPSCRKLYLEEVQQWLQEDSCRLRLTILRLEREHRPYTADELRLRLAQEEPSAPLTTYVSRHSWASIARSRQVPIVTISEALGHDNETTTRIYLSTLDTTEVDRVNRKILASLK